MNRWKKKIVGVLTWFFIVLLALSSIGLVYSILLYKGIETFYRLMIIILIIYILGFLSYLFILAKKKDKFKLFITSSILSIIFISLFTIGVYYIYTLYHKINKFNKDTVTYTTVLLSFSENYTDINNIKDAKIAIVDDENNYESNILALEVISKYKLETSNEIIRKSNTLELISSLYNEEVDIIFINSNYFELFGKLEGYEDINDKSVEIYKYSKNYSKKQIENEHTDSSKSLTDPFTILLLGVDSEKDGLDKNAAFNGDTIMLISFNPETLQATMFSIPRDTYVPVTCSSNVVKKINTSAYGGTGCVINTVEKFTGIEIDYYAKINFKGVVDLVDALDKIKVDVPMDFCESNSDRLGGKNEICLKKGVQEINGEEALALSRHRKTLLLGDYQRAQHQQLVVEGMLNKGKSIKNVNKLYEILDAVSKNIDTNLTSTQMLSFYNVLKSLMFSDKTNILNIQKTFLRGYNLYVYEEAIGDSSFAFFNWKGSLNAITNAMKINLNLKQGQLIKTFDFSINELYEREIIGDNSYNETKQALVPNFLSYSLSEAQTWAKNHNLKFTVKDYSTKNEITDYSNYTIINQKEPIQTLVSRISSVTVYVTEINKSTTNDTETTPTPTENNPDVPEETIDIE